MATLRVLLLNLAKEKLRLEFQLEQAKTLGLDLRRLEAVTAEDVNDHRYQELAFRWERPLRRTEVACFLSHKNAWQDVADQSSPALILEDDAVLSSKLPLILDSLSTKSGLDLVTLENRGRKKHVGKHQLPLDKSTRLVRLYQDRTGAAAYVLWPSGARKLLDRYQREGASLADAFIATSYGLNAYQIEPAAAIQADHCRVYNITERLQTTTSTTPEQHPRPKPSSVLQTISFKLRRVRGQLQLALHLLSVSHKTERRYIRIRPEDFQ